MNPDRIFKEIQSQEPTPAEIDQAVERVRARLFPKADAGAPTGAIRSCADFTALIPALLAGSLDPGRRLLLEVHTRECVACRKALAAARSGTGHVVEFRPRQARQPRYAGWAIAAAALLTTGIGAWWAFHQSPAIGGGPRATVATVEGALYRVSGTALVALAPGAELGENEAVRTGKNSTATLRLNDGSRIELNQRAQVFVTRSWSGSTIHLTLGNIIVEAAKQHRGTLQVATADCNVSVKGTVFSVDAGMKGSRVAVVEGTVWVDHGKQHEVLKRGGMTSTAPDMEPVPIAREFEWSRRSEQYLSLLAEFREIHRQLDAIPSPGLRYNSKLLQLLPADVVAVVAIPNIGGAVAQANRIFHDRLKQSEALSAWYDSLPAARRSNFETAMARIEDASAYLGDEIVVAAGSLGGHVSPIVLAQLTRPGLDTFLKERFPDRVAAGHMSFDNGLFVAAPDAGDTARLTGGFENTPLYRRIAPVYRQGAGWLFAADLAKIPAMETRVADARFLVAESRALGGRTENRASVAFAHNRQGVVSWLSAPGPMGSLEFVSPDAGFAASMLLKNPSAIVDDFMKTMARAAGDGVQSDGMAFRDSTGVDLKADLASAFGGEVTVALDGPLFPAPSWKIAAEVYYPERLQSSISKIVTAFNAQTGHAKTGDLILTQSQDADRTYYRLRFEKLPWEAHWTFVDGYWLAAANRELLVRSIGNRAVGYSLPKSAAFLGELPSDGGTNFSAVIYHHMGRTLAPLADLLGSVNVPQAAALRVDDKPGAICFRALADSIDVSMSVAGSGGGPFGMNIESVLAMQGSGPLQMLGQAIASGARK